ncbi:MAG: TIR domain-containing protein [Haliscomenobacteraceae bacterium CHB4]|nr:TIR domain-containing protein [Haliscomenobacteraceae bacterium CHB4]
MSELALKLIRENIEKHCRGEDARFLDLGNCGMTEVPEEIGECVWVEELILANEWRDDKKARQKSQNFGQPNNISRLSESFVYLKNLKKLSIRGSWESQFDLSNLSPLADLKNLQQLDCSCTRVIDLLPIANLNNLIKLDCSSTLVSDLSPLLKLKKLREIDCSSTKVIELSALRNLNNLTSLDFRFTEVNDLSPLSGLVKLKYLNCSRTRVSDLSTISNLKNLKTLFCANTNITDLSPVEAIIDLRRFACAGNQIFHLTSLSKFTNLELLVCSQTEVSDLSPVLPLIKKGRNVYWESGGNEILVEDCPLIIPPVEVAQESPQAVRDYFEELGEDGRKLNEVKVIFLGEASAGKTSLVKRLLDEDFDSKESQTHGIRIRKAPFAMDDGDSVTAHLWDFGGQEVMHATHQFFLSQRSVYVLLLNSRNDDQAEKWLKHAASFGGRSPVLVVLNKIDENPSFEVNRKTLQEKHPQIRDFFRLSAKTDKGLDEFREALRREIDRADTRRTPFPKHWLAVKEHFSNMEADYIESAEYRRVCEANGVTRQFSQDVLLQFLHDLGVVINFRNLKNFDTQILNPLWLTNGVYRIINSYIVANMGGLLHEDDFDAVINDPRYKKDNTSDRVFEYPKNKLQYIVRVMQEFELCFQLDARTYVVPQLLPVQEPEFKTEGALLRFEIHFPDFLPDSIFPRLMVKLHTFIERDPSDRVTQSHPVTTPRLTMWRTGMVLHKPNIFKALARVRWDKEDQKILVDVCGEERRRFLSFIRETVKEIVADFTNLEFNELVPIPDTKKDIKRYSLLVAMEKAGKEDVFSEELEQDIPLVALLDGVEEPAMRNEVEQLPVKAFVSYSHADLEHLKELKNALAPLIRLNKLQIWDDKNIEAGDEWEKVIFQQLEEADIVLCLVSADFVASDFCYKKEFGAALEAHRKGEKTIVPVMLRKTDWQDLPLAEIQGTPGEWITLAKDKDEAWTKVSESLRPALDKAKQRRKVLLEKRKGMM